MKTFQGRENNIYITYDKFIDKKFHDDLIKFFQMNENEQLFIGRNEDNGQLVLVHIIPFDYVISYSGAHNFPDRRFEATSITIPDVVRMIKDIEEYGCDNITVKLYFAESRYGILSKEKINKHIEEFKDKIYRYYGVHINNVVRGDKIAS